MIRAIGSVTQQRRDEQCLPYRLSRYHAAKDPEDRLGDPRQLEPDVLLNDQR